MKLTKIARGVEDLAHLLPGPLTGKLLAVREGYLVHIMGTIYGTRASERSFPLPLHLVPQRVEIGVVRTFTGGGTPYINESGSLVIPAGGELNPGYMNFTYLTTTPPPPASLAIFAYGLATWWAGGRDEAHEDHAAGVDHHSPESGTEGAAAGDTVTRESAHTPVDRCIPRRGRLGICAARITTCGYAVAGQMDSGCVSARFHPHHLSRLGWDYRHSHRPIFSHGKSRMAGSNAGVGAFHNRPVLTSLVGVTA